MLFSELFESLRLDDEEDEEDSIKGNDKVKSKKKVILDAEEDTTRHNRLVNYYQNIGFEVKPGAMIQVSEV